MLRRLHCTAEADNKDTRRTRTGSTYLNVLLSSKITTRKEMISRTLCGRRMRDHSLEARSTFLAMVIAILTSTTILTLKKQRSTQSWLHEVRSSSLYVQIQSNRFPAPYRCSDYDPTFGREAVNAPSGCLIARSLPLPRDANSEVFIVDI